MIDSAGIRRLIPHAGAMCLLDQILHWDRDTIRCTATSHRDPANPLMAGGRLGAACGVEYAAQAMAAHGRLSGSVDEAPRKGYLLSVRGLTLHVERLDRAGDLLVIEVKRLAGEGAQVSYGFTIACAGQTLVEGRAAVLLEASRA